MSSSESKNAKTKITKYNNAPLGAASIVELLKAIAVVTDI